MSTDTRRSQCLS